MLLNSISKMLKLFSEWLGYFLIIKKLNCASFNFHIQTNVVIIFDESYSEINFFEHAKVITSFIARSKYLSGWETFGWSSWTTSKKLQLLSSSPPQLSVVHDNNGSFMSVVEFFFLKLSFNKAWSLIGTMQW